MEKSAKLMAAYVTFLRALYLLHQNHHWQTPRYDLHLMFQRLYEDVAQQTDEAAEKTVGLFGLEALNISQNSKLLGDLVGTFAAEKHNQNYLEAALKAEEQFLKFNKKVYNLLKEDLTLGLDDMIMTHASAAETRIYLLKQSLSA